MSNVGDFDLDGMFSDLEKAPTPPAEEKPAEEAAGPEDDAGAESAAAEPPKPPPRRAEASAGSPPPQPPPRGKSAPPPISRRAAAPAGVWSGRTAFDDLFSADSAPLPSARGGLEEKVEYFREKLRRSEAVTTKFKDAWQVRDHR